MNRDTPVGFDDLLAAFEWVSAGAPTENSAYVSRKTGDTHWVSNSIPEVAVA